MGTSGHDKEATVRTISERRVLTILLLFALGGVAGCGTTLSPAPIVRASATALAIQPTASLASLQPTPAATGSPTAAPSASGGVPSAAPAASPASSAAPTATAFDPSSFAGPVNNPWFPLIAGTTLVYQGTKEGQAAVDTVAVTSKTKLIAGVKAVAVHHDLALNGVVMRQTDDWFAQDRQGNVWQLGRTTVESDPGEPDEVGNTGGSWEAGATGAQPGIVMPAKPQIGDSGVRAILPGKIEDHVVVLLTNGTAKVPAGTFSNVLQTEEWSPFAPETLTLKAYVQGTGLVREAEIAGGDDILELVKVTRP